MLYVCSNGMTASRLNTESLQHRNTEENNPAIPFEFNKINKELVGEVLSRYPSQYKKAAVMPLLDLGQRQHGFTSISVMNEVARILEMPPMRVYEVATFYTMYNRDPVGRFHVQCCGTVRMRYTLGQMRRTVLTPIPDSMPITRRRGHHESHRRTPRCPQRANYTR